MKHSSIARPYLFGMAVLGWFALISQLYLNLSSGISPWPETLVRYFSYFTLDTNLLVALCCTVLLVKPGSKAGRFFSRAGTLTAITLYILVVGLVYNLILRSLWNPKGLQKWVDELLHSVIPLLFLIWWINLVAKGTLTMRTILPWMIYPLGYAVFILIRGSLSGFYPYPFVDVTSLGLQGALINALLLCAMFLLISLLFLGLDRLLSRATGLQKI